MLWTFYLQIYYLFFVVTQLCEWKQKTIENSVMMISVSALQH